MMVVLHEMRRRGRFLVGPLLGLALTSYFVYHTIEGDRGLRAWRDINQQLRGISQLVIARRPYPVTEIQPWQRSDGGLRLRSTGH